MMLRSGDSVIVKNDNGRFYKGCEVVVVLNMTEKAKRVGDNKPIYVRTKDGLCCAWYAENDLQKVEG